MKKIVAIAVLGVFVLASCKKDYTCTCTSGGTTYEYTMTESKKAAAAAVCEGKGIGGYEVGGVAVSDDDTESCSLK